MRIDTNHIHSQENFCSTYSFPCFEEINTDWRDSKKDVDLNSGIFESTLGGASLFITNSNISSFFIEKITEIGELSTLKYPYYFFDENLKAFSQIDAGREKIINKLKSYQLYRKGWDGYDGIPPLNQAISDAINFLEKLPMDCPLPYVSLSGDGEIGFFWEVRNIFIDVGFFGDHTFSYFARDEKSEKYFGDDVLLLDNLPYQLIKVIYSTE